MRDELKIFSEIHNCSICLNDIKANSSVVTPCGHLFHQDCLSEWLYTANKHTCPICRENYDNNDMENELYSVLDLLESPDTRMRIRQANIHLLIDRIHDYDDAMDLASFFLSI